MYLLVYVTKDKSNNRLPNKVSGFFMPILPLKGGERDEG